MAVTAPSRLLIPLVASFCIACASYAGSAKTSNKMSQKILLDMNSNGKKIELKVGDEIQIELKAMGSAGYAWYFDKLDQNFFYLIGEERKDVALEKGDVVGTSVLMVWKLRAKKSGTTFIRMSHYRQWEGKDKAINQFEILVDITP
ncbi:MAG TPA: protease inhibitor I42 family protein [Thermodesulfobacteriota bacterium]|nr:protease inhibitor I42 family protein [Thermodesulfobacteriota bacterium]